MVRAYSFIFADAVIVGFIYALLLCILHGDPLDRIHRFTGEYLQPTLSKSISRLVLLQDLMCLLWKMQLYFDFQASVFQFEFS